jgi:RNA polymerase sigma-70 factor (ECF subfamily)
MGEGVEQLWRTYHGGLHRFIRARVGDPDAVEDLLQEVFIKAHRSLATVHDGGRVQGWLYRITRNVVVDYYRGRRELDRLPEDLAAESPESTVEARRELARCLVPFIDRLPEHYRQAMLLSEIEGRPQRQVAEALGLSLSGAKSRVQRGRVMLKDQLSQCCRLEFDHRGALTDYEPPGGKCTQC